ncbi:MAG: SIMPL domain-containing protein [Rhodobacteraceae bacterium]|jgi:hypothetical protein|nr:SIMPL domain-containing protein [Paracoccaceae bacterium]
MTNASLGLFAPRAWRGLCRSALVILLALPAAAQPAAQPPAPPRPLVVVTGEGRVEAVPDMATITLGAQTDADTAAEALAATSAATVAILQNLTAAGIAPRDMQTDALSLSPRYDYGRSDGQPVLQGYTASNTVRVRVRDLALLGAQLDAAVAAGGNRFDGLSFGLQDPGPSEDAARARAVQDALRKAALYAQAAGLGLGPVVSIVEQGSFAGPAPMFRADALAAAPPVPVAPGEVSTVASVVVTIELVAP